MLLSPLSVSSIASSISSAAVSAGKEVKAGTGTSAQCNCNYILFTKLPWPGDSEGTFRSSSQAATCASVYHTRWRLHTVPLIAERQAGKL